MRKQSLFIAIVLLVTSSWNSFAFAESVTSQDIDTTLQSMIAEHCDHASETSDDSGMSCLKHCAAIYALPASYQLSIPTLNETVETVTAFFKPTLKSFSHWRPPSFIS